MADTFKKKSVGSIVKNGLGYALKAHLYKKTSGKLQNARLAGGLQLEDTMILIRNKKLGQIFAPSLRYFGAVSDTIKGVRFFFPPLISNEGSSITFTRYFSIRFFSAFVIPAIAPFVLSCTIAKALG